MARQTGEAVSTTLGAVLKILADEFGIRLLLHEGGPTIFGQAIAVKVIDEFFYACAANRPTTDRCSATKHRGRNTLSSRDGTLVRVAKHQAGIRSSTPTL